MGNASTHPLPQPVLQRNTLPVKWKMLQDRKIIRCDVVFGSPSLGCRGTGVCKIIAHQAARPDGQRRDCKSATAFLTAMDGGRSLSMILLNEYLCVGILRNHLRHNTLEIKEPCTLPAEFVQSLGLRLRSIRPGSYPVIAMSGYYQIIFS